MIDKKIILDKIKETYGFKTDTEFASFLGIKQNTLSNWRARNTLDYELITSKCENINANWLFTGEGDVLNESVFEDQEPYILDNSQANIQDRINQLENKYEELRNDFHTILRSIELINKK